MLTNFCFLLLDGNVSFLLSHLGCRKVHRKNMKGLHSFLTLVIYGWNVVDSDNRQSQWHCKSPTGNETPTKVLDCFYESSHKHFNKMIQCPQIITWFKYEWNAGDSFKMQEFRCRVIIPRSGFSLFCGSIRASSIHFLFSYWNNGTKTHLNSTFLVITYSVLDRFE